MLSGFFDLDNRYDQLSKLRNPLVELNQIMRNASDFKHMTDALFIRYNRVI